MSDNESSIVVNMIQNHDMLTVCMLNLKGYYINIRHASNINAFMESCASKAK